jgi:hypothetical protein
MKRWYGMMAAALAMVAIALQVGADAGAEKPKPIVTVTKADQSTVRGRLIAYDADVVTLEVGPKAGEGEIVEVRWDEIAKVSNGLTHAKALDEWKQANADKLCQACHGNRVTRCPDCRGTGHDHAASADCAKCKGEGEVQCAQPRCVGGRVPCTNKCIKLTEGTWVKKEDGKRWRTIKMGKGSLQLSEAHAGELWVEENGQPVNKGKCPTCAGATTIACARCEATGKMPCPTCVAKKDASDCPTCDGGKVSCSTCEGTGLKKGDG